MADPAVVSGPIAGGAKGRVFGTPLVDLAAYGYREDEFFLEGTAARYRPRGGALSRDGRWDVEAVESAPYRTRFVVYRPANPQTFNGTVFVSWNNVSAGFDGYQAGSPEILETGGAYVAVTAQRAGARGMGPHPMGLEQWDPERYGSLSIPSDDYSFDIFAQAGRAVGSARPRLPVDPMGGLDVRHLVATGASQSAGRLASYINAVEPIERAYDAFLLTLYFGGGSPLEVGEAVFNPASGRLPSTPTQLREDLTALIMVVNSEVEAIACYGVRQPDTERFRYWEAAGTAHVSRQGMQQGARRGGGAGTPALNIDGINEVPLNPVTEAGNHHIRVWVSGGPPPPRQPLIDFAGDPAEVVRDDNGIARGGIRLPQVEVPLATNSAVPAGDGTGPLGRLGGSCVPFPAEEVRALYGGLDTYLNRFEQAARAAEKAAVILPRDVEPSIKEARRTFEAAIRGAGGHV